jgi:hypothetical protein
MSNAPRSIPLPLRGERLGHLTPDIPKLLDRLPAIVYVADTGDAGRWHFVSHQIEEILGFSPGESGAPIRGCGQSAFIRMTGSA